MSLTDRITGRDRTPCFYLWVAGVPVLYGSVMPPPRQYQGAAGAIDYERRVAIQVNNGFQFNRRMDVEEHVIQADPVEVHLISDEQYSDDPNDPGKVFGKMGYSGATNTAGFIAGQSISQTAAPPFLVTVDSSGNVPFASGDVVHISREAFHVAAVDNAAKTVKLSKRGMLGTIQQRHEFSLDTGVRPIITKPAVYFKGRKAIIFENTINEDGSVDHDKWVERWRGFLASEPEPGEMGMIHTIRLRISPLSAALDRPLGKTGNNETRLSNKYHTFGTTKTDTGNITSRLGSEVHMLEMIYQGTVYSDDGGTHMVNRNVRNYRYREQEDGTGPEGVPVQSFANHTEVFDPVNLPLGHPRTGPIISKNVVIAGGAIDDRVSMLPTSYSNNYNAVGANPAENEKGILGTFPDLGADHWQRGSLTREGVVARVPVEWDANGEPVDFEDVVGQVDNERAGSPGWFDGWHNANTSEWRAGTLWDYSSADFPQTYAWPDRLFHAVEEGWNDEDTKAAKGGFTRCRIDYTDPMRPDLVFSLTRDVRPAVAEVLLSNDDAFMRGRYYQRTQQQFQNAATNPSNGFQWTDQGQTKKTLREGSRCVSSAAFLLGSERDVEDGEEPAANGAAFVVSRGNPERAPTRIAQAFYQTGEFFITVDDEPFLPGGATLLYRAFMGDEDEPFCTFQVESSQSVQVDGDTVYVLTLATTADAGHPDGRPIRSFATYPGDPDIRLEPAIRFANESVGTLLLKLLCSSGGDGVTSTIYDTLPFGCGFTDGTTGAATLAGADVDAGSFLSIPNPIGQARISAQLLTGETVADVCVGLLRAVGYTIDIQTVDSGGCLLRAVPLGIPSVSDVVAQIGETDIVAGRLSSPAENSIFNAFTFVANFDTNGVEEPISRTIVDAVSIQTFGEEKRLTVELRGIELDEGLDFLSQLRPMFSRLRREFSFPRRLWRFSVRSGLSTQMRLGGTYSVSHSLLRGVSGLGVSSALGRLRSVKSNGWKSTAECVFVVYGESGSGWGPGADITGIIDATTVEVSANTHSALTHPNTGAALSDSGIGSTLFDTSTFGLMAAKTVFVYAAGDMDGGQLLEVSSVDTSVNPHRIQFTAAHNISAIAGETVHGHIIPDVFEPPAAHKDYAYIDRVLVV